MSCYERIKAVRCRLKNTEQCFDKYKYIDDIVKALGINGELNVRSAYNFDTDTSEYYIDYTLFRSYGKQCDHFAFSRNLTTKESKKYLKYFKKISPDIKTKDLRYVDYCYYNGVDEPAVFEIKEV